MVVKPNAKVASFKSAYRDAAGQSSSPPPREERKGKGRAYNDFMRRYALLDLGDVDGFGLWDLLFYFREKARESGYEPPIGGSAEGKMKGLMQRYGNRDICCMIDFAFSPEQEYLPKWTIGVGTLLSGWGERLYSDSQAWSRGEYVPEGARRRREMHEWDGSLVDGDDVVDVGI